MREDEGLEAVTSALLEAAQAWGAVPDHPSASYGDVLHRIALTANSSLDIKDVLERLANLTLEAVPADRCSIFLLDDSGTKLTPTFSVARAPDATLWRRFKEVAPVDLVEVPSRWRAFSRGRAIGIPDMAASPLIPEEFVEVFRSRAAILAPLNAAGEPQGLLSLDWTGTGHAFDQEEIALVEAIGAIAALAVRNARLYQGLSTKARTLERLGEVAGALNSSLSLRSVLDLICEAIEELLETVHCSVNLIDIPGHEAGGPGVRTLSVRGISWFTGDPEIIRSISEEEVQRVKEVWARSPEPVIYPDTLDQAVLDRSLIPPSVRSAALFPLVRPGGLLGFILAGYPDAGGLSPEHLEAGRALADEAATAIGRAILHESLRMRLQRTEILYRLSDVVGGTTDLTSAVRQLNRMLRPELGVELRSIVIANPQIREAVGATAPDECQMEAIRSWRALLSKSAGAVRPRPNGAGLLVPLVHRRRVQGALSVKLDPVGFDPSDEELLMAIGGGCAEVIYKAGLRRALGQSERRLAIAKERERIARDLHDSVGQLLTGMGMQLASYIPDAPDARWRGRMEELMKQAAKGSREVRGAIHSMLFLQVQNKGLLASLRDLCRQFEATTGLRTNFRADGKPLGLVTGREDALFRVVHEALMNVEKHSRASMVSVKLTFGATQVSVVVNDDGVGIAHRDPFGGSPGHYGLRGIQRLMEEVGGSLEIKDGRPRGLRLTARVPVAGGKGRKRASDTRARG